MNSHTDEIFTLTLKRAILDSGLTQRAIARELGIDDCRMSNIVHGRYSPTKAQRRVIAKLLRRDQSELFPEPVSA